MAFCSSCGTQVVGGSFCTSCGGSISHNQVQSQNGAPPVPTTFPTNATGEGNSLSTVGMILGAIGFLFFPVVIGVAGIVFSAVAKSKGENNANLALGISIAGTVLGMIVGAAVLGSSF